MNNDEIKLVVQVLKEHVNENEEIAGNPGLSMKDLELLRNESAACCKAIRILEEMED